MPERPLSELPPNDRWVEWARVANAFARQTVELRKMHAGSGGELSGALARLVYQINLTLRGGTR